MRDAFGAKRVFLATDSDEAARELANLLDGDGMELTLIGFNRSLVGGSSAANVGKAVNKGTTYIEDRLRQGDPGLDRTLAVSSLLAELELLSSADMLIGTSTSWVSRLAFLALVGRRADRRSAGALGTLAGGPPPFIFLDAPFGWLWDRGVKGVKC